MRRGCRARLGGRPRAPPSSAVVRQLSSLRSRRHAGWMRARRAWAQSRQRAVHRARRQEARGQRHRVSACAASSLGGRAIYHECVEHGIYIAYKRRFTSGYDSSRTHHSKKVCCVSACREQTSVRFIQHSHCHEKSGPYKWSGAYTAGLQGHPLYRQRDTHIEYILFGE